MGQGDGRLGILCAWALSTALSDVTLIGRHTEKLSLALPDTRLVREAE